MSKEMYCPYCSKKVETRLVNWWMVLLTVLTGSIIIYLLYCLLIGSRICRGCKCRIYDIGLEGGARLEKP